MQTTIRPDVTFLEEDNNINDLVRAVEDFFSYYRLSDGEESIGEVSIKRGGGAFNLYPTGLNEKIKFVKILNPIPGRECFLLSSSPDHVSVKIGGDNIYRIFYSKETYDNSVNQ